MKKGETEKYFVDTEIAYISNSYRMADTDKSTMRTELTLWVDHMSHAKLHITTPAPEGSQQM